MMGKGKKGGKRMSKKQLSERLQDFFASQPGKTLSFKEIFRALKLDTHPLKMLAIDIMEEMTWDDFLTRVHTNSPRKVRCKKALSYANRMERTRSYPMMAAHLSSFQNAIRCGQPMEIASK